MESVGAAYPHPNHVLLHSAGTHLVGAGLLCDDVDARERLGQTFAAGEACGVRPETVIFTRDHADKGEPEAYRKFRGAAGAWAWAGDAGAEAGLQGRDGAQSCNTACLHGRTVMNSVLPVGSYPPAASGTCTGNPPGTGNFPEGTTE